MIALLLAVGFEAADTAADPETSRALIALVNFAQGKEYAGQERATAGAALVAAASWSAPTAAICGIWRPRKSARSRSSAISPIPGMSRMFMELRRQCGDGAVQRDARESTRAGPGGQ